MIMRPSFKRLRPWSICLTMAGLYIVIPSSPAAAQVVISQIYGGGGENFSTFTNDFVELYNAGVSPVSMPNWSIQYAAATGTSWTVTTINATIQPGRYLLIQEGGGTALPAGQTCGLPAPDVIGTINLATTAGKVALVSNNVALSGSNPTGPAIQDFVGFGTTANAREPQSGGVPANNAPPPTADSAIFRRNCGAADTNNNAADFNRGFPSPHNSASPPNLGLVTIGGASPMVVRPGDDVRITATPGLCATGSLPAPTSVTANFTSLGGSPFQALFDDATHGDDRAADGIFSFVTTVSPSTPAGSYSLALTYSDGTRSGGSYVSVVVLPSTAPINDNAATAQPLGPLPQAVSGDFTGATAESNPIAALATAPTNGMSSRRGVWYSVIGTGNTITADTCNSPLVGGISIPDTVLIVFCGTPDGLTVVGNNDDLPVLCGAGSGTELRSRVSWCSIFGTPYYLWVAPFATGAQTLSYVLTVGDDGSPCTGAIACTSCTPTPGGGSVAEVEPAYGIARNDGCDTTPNTFTEVGSIGPGMISIAGTSRGYGDVRDVDWYRFQATTTDQLNVSVTAQFSAIVSIHQLSGGVCPATQLAVSASSDRCGPATVSASMTAGNTYAVRILHAPTPTAFGGVAVSGTSCAYVGTLTVGGSPPNDACAGAVPLTLGASPLVGNTSAATNDGSASCDAGGPASRDVWYSLTVAPAPNAMIRIDTCGSSIDTALAVYAGTCGSLSQIACNDNCPGLPCGGTASCVTLPASVGPGTYYIRVSDKGLSSGGFSIRASAIPANDDCANAIPITEGVYFWDNTGATTDGNLYGGRCDAQVGGTDVGTNSNNDIWYLYTASCSGDTYVTTCGTPPAGTALSDTVIAVYSFGVCPPPDVVRLACDDDIDPPFVCAAGGTLRSALSFPAVAGVQYLIRVGSYSPTATGTGLLTVSGASNETCATATAVNVASGSASVTASNACALTDGTGPACRPSTNRDLWWTMTTGPSQAGIWQIDTCGSTIDSVLTVYSGTCAALAEVACNVTAVNGACRRSAQSAVLVNLAASTQYRIRVASRDNLPGGSITLNFGFPVGACYTPDGTCQLATASSCASLSGQYQGDNTACPPSGACCFGNGSCRITIDVGPFACHLPTPGQGGVYQGDGSVCGNVTYAAPTVCTDLFEDISLYGTAVSRPLPGTPNLGNDGFVTGIPIGFTFVFFGQSKTSVNISANGFVSFGSAGLGSPTPQPFPDVAVPNDTIAPLWADLDAAQGSATISYATIGRPGSRCFIVAWKNIPRHNLGDSNSFEIILFEGSNCIQFRYGGITAPTALDTSVGLEDSLGTTGTNVAPGTLGLGATCRRFCPGGSPACPQPTGACCMGINCMIMTGPACQANGGVYRGDGSICTPSQCTLNPCDNWIGTTGVWSNPGNWSAGVPDNQGPNRFCVEIHGPNSNVTIDGNLNRTIDSLWVDHAFLNVTQGDLTIASSAGILDQGAIVVGTGHKIQAAVGTDFAITGSGPLRLAGGTIFSAAGDTITNSIGHTIAGGSVIDSDLVNDGLILADVPGSILTIQGPGIINSHTGEIRAINGARIDILTTVGGSSGYLAMYGGTVKIDSPMVHFEGVSVLPGSISTLDIMGSTIANLDAMTVTGGNTTIGGTAHVTSLTAVNVSPASPTAVATVTLGASAQVTGNLNLGAAGASLGTLSGTGTIGGTVTNGGGLIDSAGTINGNLINGSGRVAPGGSGPARLTVHGTFSQAAGGIMDLELGGTSTGQFDVIDATSAVLGGTLRVTAINGHIPMHGNTYDIVQSSGMPTGTFANVQVTNFPASLTAVPSIIAGGVRLRALSCCDMNCDLSRDIVDVQLFVAVLLGGGGPPCSSCAGDMDLDGVVSGTDIQGFVSCLFAP